MAKDDERQPITLRLPTSLLSRLKEEASTHSHSMNAEIVGRLEASFNIIGLRMDGKLKGYAIKEEYSEAMEVIKQCAESLKELMHENRSRLAELGIELPKANPQHASDEPENPPAPSP